MGNSQSVSSIDSEKNALDCLARLQPKLEENLTWCRLLTAERPMGKIRRWARPAALAEFESLRQQRLAHSAREVGRVGTQPTSAGRMYLRTGDQAPAVANFPRSSRVQSPSTEESLVLLTQFDTTRLLTGEDGLTLRNMAHAAMPNAWLSLQYSSWTCTMLQPLRNAGKSEAECVEAFFMHVQKMFNLPNLFRLSLTQLKTLKQEDLIAGAAFLLRFMQTRITTMQLAHHTGRTQWEFATEQACGDQLLRGMMPEYLKQLLLVAASDPLYRDCPKQGFPCIVDPVGDEKTMLSLCETTDGIFSNLASSFEDLESKTGRGNRSETGGRKWEAEPSSRPPRMRTTYVHTTQTQAPSCGSSSAAVRAPARPFRPTGTGPGGCGARMTRIPNYGRSLGLEPCPPW